MPVLLKSGYYVFVRSRENDADNYRDEMVHVETIEKAMLLAKFCSLFVPYNEGGIGNVSWSFYGRADRNEHHTVEGRIVEFFQENPSFGESFGVLPRLAGVGELLTKTGLSSDDYMTRVAETVEVRRFDAPVVYDLVYTNSST